MAFKKFSDHSARWQREKLRDGVTPGKWNAWGKLSPKSKKITNPTAYGQGETVVDQIRKPLLDQAAQNVVGAQRVRGAQRDSGRPIDLAVARRNLNAKGANVSAAKLRKIGSMSRADLAEMIDESLSNARETGDRSPFWYNKKG